MRQHRGAQARKPTVALVTYDVFGHQGSGRVISELVQRAHDRLDFVIIANSVAAELKPLVRWAPILRA